MPILIRDTTAALAARMMQNLVARTIDPIERAGWNWKVGEAEPRRTEVGRHSTDQLKQP